MSKEQRWAALYHRGEASPECFNTKAKDSDHADYDYYECGVCGHIHPWAFRGDCRDDANRFTSDQLPADARIAGMEERVAADEAGEP